MRIGDVSRTSEGSKAENTGFNWNLFWGSGIIMALYLGKRDSFGDIYASRTIYK